MLKILVPYDGSKPSDNAFNQAVRLAEATKNSSIILLHVLPEIPIPTTFERPVRSQKTGKSIPLSEYVQELYEVMKLNAQEMLNKKTGLQGVSVTTRLSIGRIADEILKCAKKEKVDLIVIGNVGLGGIRKLKMLGSVSRRVSERADRPVMIVH